MTNQPTTTIKLGPAWSQDPTSNVEYDLLAKRSGEWVWAGMVEATRVCTYDGTTQSSDKYGITSITATLDDGSEFTANVRTFNPRGQVVEIRTVAAAKRMIKRWAAKALV